MITITSHPRKNERGILIWSTSNYGELLKLLEDYIREVFIEDCKDYNDFVTRYEITDIEPPNITEYYTPEELIESIKELKDNYQGLLYKRIME